MSYVAAILRGGHLPLWTSQIYSGFPLFADPEAGTLYPLNWLLILVNNGNGLLLVLFGSALIAALATFFYVRNLGVGLLPAVIASWVYALGGFATGHLVHVSISNSAGPMPLLLLATDRAIVATSRRRVAWLMVAIGIHALQWLAGHVQPPLMSLMLLVPYMMLRLTTSDAATRGLIGRVRQIAGAIAWSFGILIGALAIAAVQYIPSLELALQSSRAGPVSKAFAASYQFAPFDLLTLVLPYFFQTSDGVRWGLWANWETAAYAGIAPLLLAAYAVCGLFAARNWHRWSLVFFYTIVACGSLWLALGDYVPLPLYGLLQPFPPFNLLRASARFLMLFDFALAILASLGAEVLLNSPELMMRWRNRVSWGYAAAIVVMIGLCFGCAGWIGANGDAAIAWLDRFYRAAPNAGLLPGGERLLDNLKSSVWLGTASFARSILLLVTGGALIIRCVQGRLARSMQAFALVCLTLIDLSLYAANFWQATPIAALSRPDMLTGMLMAGQANGRILDLRHDNVESNRLMQWNLADAAGYSSLELSREAQVRDAMRTYSNRLLDLAGVSRIILSLSNSDTESGNMNLDDGFNLRSPLLNISSVTPHSERTFTVGSMAATRPLLLISALSHAPHIRQGEEVARLVVVTSDGYENVIPIRAGIETAEWAIERPDVSANARHGLAPVAYSEPTRDEYGAYVRHLYRFETTLGGAGLNTPASIRLEVTAPNIHWLVYALGFEQGYRLRRFDLESFHEYAHVDGARIISNVNALPRAWLVHRARTLSAEDVWRTMNGPGFDPGSEVLLEEPAPMPIACVPDTTGCEGDTVSLSTVSEEELRLHSSSAADAYLMLADTWYSGWVAREGDSVLPILRGNYIYRAIFIPAGAHDITLTFEPWPVLVGGTVTALSMAAGVCALCWGLRGSAAPAAVRRCASVCS